MQLAHSLVSRGRTRRLIERVSEDNAINFKQRHSFRPAKREEQERTEERQKKETIRRIPTRLRAPWSRVHN